MEVPVSGSARAGAVLELMPWSIAFLTTWVSGSIRPIGSRQLNYQPWVGVHLLAQPPATSANYRGKRLNECTASC
jgi:hypothetical protein